MVVKCKQTENSFISRVQTQMSILVSMKTLRVKQILFNGDCREPATPTGKHRIYKMDKKEKAISFSFTSKWNAWLFTRNWMIENGMKRMKKKGCTWYRNISFSSKFPSSFNNFVLYSLCFLFFFLLFYSFWWKKRMPINTSKREKKKLE